MKPNYEGLARRVTAWIRKNPDAIIMSDYECSTDAVELMLDDIQRHYRSGLLRHDLVTALRLAAFRGWLRYER